MILLSKFGQKNNSILNTSYSFSIYNSVRELPFHWDDLAQSNVFLSKKYLEILEKSSPENIICNFIAVFNANELVGISVSQFVQLDYLESFGDRDKCIKTTLRNFAFKKLCSNVLLIGNNMLTGQNAFAFSEKTDKKEAIKTLRNASLSLKKIFQDQGKKTHMISFKDFNPEEVAYFSSAEFKNNFQFSTQPNMVFKIHENWKSEHDYTDVLSKKYRDQYKRARKKAEGIEKRKMSLEDIIHFEETIYDLYFHVAKNAPFNTFFLPKNHFRIFKELMKDKFLFYGYFLDEKLIGFNTLIKNGSQMDTYFLGYDDSIQREKMLYLNMLYDMIFYSINKGFKEIVFARTALEIKSSVGAKPIKMDGFVTHVNPIINLFLPNFFRYFEPETIWQERNPFK